MTDREKIPVSSKVVGKKKNGATAPAAITAAIEGQKACSGHAKTLRIRKREASKAANMLLDVDPMASASLGLTNMQIRSLVIMGVCLLAGILFWTTITMSVLQWMVFLAFAMGIVFRLLLIGTHLTRSSRCAPNKKADPQEVRPESRDLPTYTILLPVYRETKMLGTLVSSIEKLAYPKELLDIKLLLEEDDAQTIAAARQLNLAGHWEVLVLPASGPKTKPRALNAGLARAKGMLVTIYDAEDRPHKGQLLAAVAAFAHGSTKLVCAQAPLTIYNRNTNWLTRQFSAEYNAHFNVLLPAMTALGVVFPLGGTSNHFKKSALKAAGGWDPHNVTEDADLAFRLARAGGQMTCIAPPTEEEATITLSAWVNQRSRWIKGYMQTLIVHLRRSRPGGSWRGGVGLSLFLGLSLVSSFLHAPGLLLALACLACWPLEGIRPDLFHMGLICSGYFVAIGLLMMGHIERGHRTGILYLPGAILYWPLQSLAAVMAAIDLILRPFHWRKTEHGHSLREDAN